MLEPSGKTYHPPGSHHWKQHIYKQRKKHNKKLAEKKDTLKNF
jgi:hypothetical protein